MDLNFSLSFCLSYLKGEANVCRHYNLCSHNGSPGMETISDMRCQIPWRSQDQDIQMRRTFSCNGFCAINISRKSSGHRSLSACYGFETISHGYQEYSVKKQSCARKRDPRLAHLSRLCSNPHQQSKDSVCQRTAWRGLRINCICPGLNDYRPLHESVSLGTISENKKRHQAPYSHESKSPRAVEIIPTKHEGR